MSKRGSLTAMLSQATKPEEKISAPIPSTEESQKASTRKNTIMIGGHFHTDVRRSLLMIRQQFPELTQQDLLAEALNDLFAKYKVPETAPKQK